MEKLKSRKFWITVVTLVVALVSGGAGDLASGETAHLDPLALGIAGLVAAAYVFVQGHIDRTGRLAALTEKIDWDKVDQLLREMSTLRPPPEPSSPSTTERAPAPRHEVDRW